MADANLLKFFEVHVFYGRDALGQVVVIAIVRAQKDAHKEILVESHLDSVGDAHMMNVDVQCASPVRLQGGVLSDQKAEETLQRTLRFGLVVESRDLEQTAMQLS